MKRLDTESLKRVLDRFCDATGTTACITSIDGEILIPPSSNDLLINRNLLPMACDNDKYFAYEHTNGVLECISPIFAPTEHIANIYLRKPCHIDELNSIKSVSALLNESIKSILTLHTEKLNSDNLANKAIKAKEEALKYQARLEALAQNRMDKLKKVIEELKEVQEEIIKSKKQQDLALRGGKMGSWNVDFQTQEMTINDKWAEMLGYTLEELQEHTRDKWIATIHQDDLGSVINTGDRYKRGLIEEYEIEYRALTKRGETRWLISRGEAVERDKDGFVLKMAGTVMDITEKKEAEEQIRASNKKVRDSINYASLIQRAILPDSQKIAQFFGSYFTIWQPKDVVGGDIYFFDSLRSHKEALLTVIDCTGHGVPGAFMTMLVKAIEKNILTELIKSDLDIHPAEILQIFNRTIKTMLKQENSSSNAHNAGFDGGVIYIDKQRDLLRYAGAQTPFFYFEDGELKSIKGDKKGVGYTNTDMNFAFVEHEIRYSKIESAILCTDGYIDQNGGKSGFPFGKKRFTEILKTNRAKEQKHIKEELEKELALWRGESEINDDITIFGFNP